MYFHRAFDPIRAVFASWDMLKRAPVAILVGGILLFVLSEGEHGQSVGEFEGFGGFDSWIQWTDLPSLLIHATVGAFSLLWTLVVVVLMSFFMTSFAGVVERVLRRGSAELADVLDPRGRFVNQLLAQLLRLSILALTMLPIWGCSFLLLWGAGSGAFGVVAVVGALLLYVIGLSAFIYLHLGLRLVDKAVSLEGMGPVDAIRRSWSLVDGNRWTLALYLLITLIFEVLGLLACGIGILVTGAMREAALNESYLRLIHSSEQQREWHGVYRDRREQLASDRAASKVDQMSSVQDGSAPEA